MSKSGWNTNKSFFVRYLNQGLNSSYQLCLNLSFLSILNIEVYGWITVFQIFLNFYFGAINNTFVYDLTLQDFKYSKNSLISTFVIFILISWLLYEILAINNPIEFSIIIILLLKIQNQIYYEKVSRYSLVKNHLKINYFYGGLRCISIFIILYSLVNSYNLYEDGLNISLLVIIEIIILVLLTIYLTTIDSGFKRLRFLKNTKHNFLFYIIYFLKSQTAPLMLSIYSLTDMGFFSATRFFAAPVTLLTPVITSYVLTERLNHNKLYNSLKYILAFGLFYLFVVLISANYFYSYFLKQYDTEILILTYTHIVLSILALYRSYLESIFQVNENSKSLVTLNIKVFFINLISSWVLIKILGVKGAIFSLITIELISTFLIFRKNDNLL